VSCTYLGPAGYEIQVYDAKTFELRSDVETPGDMTTNLFILPATSPTATADASPPQRAR
jgi:hypothetical protein